MRTATATFRRTMSQRRNFVNYADMTLSNGTILHLAPEDFRLGGNTITDDIVDGNAFTVGTAIGKTVTLAIDNSSEFFSQFDFYNAYFVLYVALPLDDGIVEKIKIGWFTVITPATTGTVISMEAVDNMYKFDRPYTDCNTVYPNTLQNIVADICIRCGVQNNTGQFDRYNMQVSNKPTGDITCRQVISYVAQIAGVNAKIDAEGSLIFTWYTDTIPERYLDGGNYRPIYKPDGSYLTGDEVDGGTFAYNDGDEIDGGLFTSSVYYHDLGFAKSVKMGTDNIEITGVKVKNGSDVERHAPQRQGWDNYCISIEDNPLTIGLEQTIADVLYAKLMQLSFRPFSLSYLQDPTIESGDWVIVEDIQHNTLFSFCTSVKFTTGGYTAIACNAESPAKQSSTYSSSSAKAVVKAQRDMNDKISYYDVMVQRMNALASNAMGMFTYEQGDPTDGSSIYYMSNRPITDNQGIANFTQGSKVWKLTGDGFFVCQNAGLTDADCTWTAGWDADNNVVVNTLSAVGINCDWIHSGTLTLGGDNNTNGRIVMKDANGNVIGTWDYTGLEVAKGSMRGLSMDLGGPLGDKSYGELKLYDTEGQEFAVFNQDGILCKSGDMRVGYKGILITDLQYGQDWSTYNTNGHSWMQLDSDEITLHRKISTGPYADRYGGINLTSDGYLNINLKNTGGLKVNNKSTAITQVIKDISWQTDSCVNSISTNTVTVDNVCTNFEMDWDSRSSSWVNRSITFIDYIEWGYANNVVRNLDGNNIDVTEGIVIDSTSPF